MSEYANRSESEVTTYCMDTISGCTSFIIFVTNSDHKVTFDYNNFLSIKNVSRGAISIQVLIKVGSYRHTTTVHTYDTVSQYHGFLNSSGNFKPSETLHRGTRMIPNYP